MRVDNGAIQGAAGREAVRVRAYETVECECGWERERWRGRCANNDCDCHAYPLPWTPESPRGACGACQDDWAGAAQVRFKVSEARAVAECAPGKAWRMLKAKLGVSKHEAKALLKPSEKP